jgi:nucleoside-diphosphate-sugar epimerase
MPVTGLALVTGAAGFVGRHFARHLRGQGWEVVGIDTEPGPGAVFCDARDFFRGSGPRVAGYDLVIHCAAVVGGRQVIEADPLAQVVNFEIDAALFRWARICRPGRIIYFSSSAAYPVLLQDGQPPYALPEDEIKFEGLAGVPDSLYGWAKLTGEFLARQAIADGMPVTVVRPFSGYGSDQDASYPLPAFTDRALRREDPFLIWGDGGQTRDFIHIDDIVRAVMAMYEQDRAGPVNLCSGHGTSMRTLAAMICRQAGYEPGFEFAPAAPSGVRYRVGNAFMLSQFCRPRVTLEEGIRRALADRAGRLARHGG